MGQACCRPSTKEDTRGADDVGTLNGAAANGVDSSGNMVDTALESDDEWWDAASFGSMRSAMSHISLDDVLDQWRDDMGDELAELEAAARSQAMEGRALSADIDRAATASSLGDSSLGLKLPPGESQLTGGRSSVLVDTAAPLGPQPSGPLVQQMEDFVRRASLPRNDPASVLVSEARELLALGRVLEAHAKLLQLCAQSGLDLPHLASHSDDLDIDIDALEADVAAVHAALAGLDDDSGYMVSRDDEFRVLYKHHKHSTRHSLKFRTTFAHPVAHILALAHEWDLLPTWNRFTLEAVKLAEPSIFESYVYGAQKAIYPFKPFQTLLHARGYDLADSHRCLLILVKDADADKLPEGHAPLPKGMAKRRRVNMLPGTCVMLRPLPVGDDGGQRTEALMIAHMDPHIPYVPAALVNFVLGFLAPYIFKQMGSMLDNKFSDPEGIFPQRIAQQPELYGMVDKRMEDFKDELGLERAVSRQGSGRAAGDEQ